MSNLAEILAEQRDSVTSKEMGELGAAVNAMNAKQDEIDAITETLKTLGVHYRQLSEVTIPALMENLGFESITLSDGRKVTVKDAIQCSIPVPLRETAYKWLDDNNHGDLIKAIVSAKFGRGDKDAALKAQQALIDMGCAASLSESVHAGTLKAWARVELEQGHSLPEDCFKVHIVKQTTVK